jgi:hypothetical protein
VVPKVPYHNQAEAAREKEKGKMSSGKKRVGRRNFPISHIMFFLFFCPTIVTTDDMP